MDQSIVDEEGVSVADVQGPTNSTTTVIQVPPPAEGGISVEPLVSEYSVHQVNADPECGQVLDCKVGRDEQTGLPRVEMVFCINRVVKSSDENAGMKEQQLMDLMDLSNDTVITSSTGSSFACPSDLQLTDPPLASYQPQTAQVSQASNCTSSPSPVDGTLQPEVVECAAPLYCHDDVTSLLRHNDRSTLEPDRADVGNPARGCSEDELNQLKRQLERRNLVRRLVLLLECAVDGRDERLNVGLVIFISLLFLVFWYVRVPIISAISLCCFIVCLLEFLHLQPAVDQFFSSFTCLSHNDESQLEAIYVRLLAAKCRLLGFARDMRALKHDHPAAYLLVAVSAFYFIGQFGNIVTSQLVVYFVAVAVVMTPIVVRRTRCSLLTRS